MRDGAGAGAAANFQQNPVYHIVRMLIFTLAIYRRIGIIKSNRTGIELIAENENTAMAACGVKARGNKAAASCEYSRWKRENKQ